MARRKERVRTPADRKPSPFYIQNNIIFTDFIRRSPTIILLHKHDRRLL
ncbi:hypothetical protein CLOHYLEM_05376 [[Clostridium] hylemonae DSM 15053]|uniref:Uncharacterized protein n=1 Tax=[Clostridium] hylemonae DSM 15053 TaxID=553973 RepID=C0BZY4_9FIRM|nr:hypothetical protein CLOHYLEM_05376 [[Clostridium] hylemonae DSM 15053]